MMMPSEIDCEVFQELLDESEEVRQTAAVQTAFGEHTRHCENCQDLLEVCELSTSALKQLSESHLSGELERRLVEDFKSWHAGQVSYPNDQDRIVEYLRGLRSQFDRLKSVQDGSMYATPEVCVALQDKAFLAGSNEPLEAIDLAELAVRVASMDAVRNDLAPGQYEDLAGRSWAILGNSKRICSDLTGAAEAFDRAERHLLRGSQDSQSWGEFLNLKASLLAERLDFAAALYLLDQAVRIYERLGNRHEKARCLLSKGMVLESWGKPIEGVEFAQAALKLVDATKDPRLLLTGKHNLIYYLKGCGRHEEAMALVPETRRLHEQLGNAADLNRFRWLEGEIAMESGDLQVAEEALLEAKQFYVQREIAYDAALVSLDLSLVFLKQGRTAEVKGLSREMLAIFRSLGIQREAFAALAFFRKALEIESTSTVAFVEELLEVLNHAKEMQDFSPRFCVPN